MYGDSDRLRLLVVQRPEDRIRAPIVRRQPRVHVEDRSAGQTDDGRLDHCGPVDGDDVRREVVQERTALVAVGGGNTTHEITAVPLEPAPAPGRQISRVRGATVARTTRSEEHTSELQSHSDL